MCRTAKRAVGTADAYHRPGEEGGRPTRELELAFLCACELYDSDRQSTRACAPADVAAPAAPMARHDNPALKRVSGRRCAISCAAPQSALWGRPTRTTAPGRRGDGRRVS